MSFQGDVAGLGLTEVLQSIARGDKDGVLELDAGDLQARLGMRSGMVFPLPAPNEKHDVWRERSERAWAELPSPELEAARRERIARAARIESIYRLLDAENVHFRFLPGSLSAWEDGEEGKGSLGQGIPVEYLLLEHARLFDEREDSIAARLAGFDVVRALDFGSRPEAERAFLEQCDGLSTLSEVADRMGWTLTQTLSVVADHFEAGTLRHAHARELLMLAQREAQRGQFGRAAERLTGWVCRVEEGPLGEGDRACLEGEWQAGRIAPQLERMPAADARTLLRRLDLGCDDPGLALERWSCLWGERRPDPMVVLRVAHWRALAGAKPPTSETNELLRFARAQQQRGNELRSQAALRLVASQLPTELSSRLELGQRLLDSGLVEQGARILVDGARELLDAGEGKKSLDPLHTVLEADPGHSGAHGLLIEAHALSARRKRRRHLAGIGLALALMLTGVAVVRVQSTRDYENRLAEVAALSDNPQLAQRLLLEHFGQSDEHRVQALRTSIQRGIRGEAKATRRAWMERWDEAEREIEHGDPVRALSLSLELPNTPRLAVDLGAWPEPTTLWTGLGDRLDLEVRRLTTNEKLAPEALLLEERLSGTLTAVLRLASDRDEGQLRPLRDQLEGLFAQLLERRAERELQRVARERGEVARQQDALLLTGRELATTGELERAVETYRRLLGEDQPEEDREVLRELFGAEAQAVEMHWTAFLEARELSLAGEHDAARECLERHCPDPREHGLPWRIESIPSGATVHVGSEHGLTPLLVESRLGATIEVELALQGFESQRLSVDGPGDVLVQLHRAPELEFSAGHAIDAAAIPVGADYMIADRGANVARVTPDGQVRWRRRLDSLGGIARTPVLLPGRPGHMLVVSEHGEAWLIEAESGSIEGPWAANSPPMQGPLRTRSGMSVRFTDGRIAVWTDALEPEVYSAEELYVFDGHEHDDGAEVAGQQLLRRSADEGSVLESTGGEWTIEVREHDYLVRQGPPGSPSFGVRRVGAWNFVSLEAPNALVPRGRLWISDDAGLRAVLLHADALSAGYE